MPIGDGRHPVHAAPELRRQVAPTDWPTQSGTASGKIGVSNFFIWSASTLKAVVGGRVASAAPICACPFSQSVALNCREMLQELQYDKLMSENHCAQRHRRYRRLLPGRYVCTAKSKTPLGSWTVHDSGADSAISGKPVREYWRRYLLAGPGGRCWIAHGRVC